MSRRTETGYQEAPGECQLHWVRRTVWNGDQELYEIQMPDDATHRENDTQPVQLPLHSTGFDPNPFYGRVAYTYGMGIDQPLSVTRANYVDLKAGASHLIFSPFAVVPLWNSRGESDDGYFADTGLRTRCAPSDASRCVRIGWISQWRLLGHADLDPLFWHGTLLQDKRTETRTFYRRNRYYDPATGQFTQEDPIGLAGGLNLYGFANGDPVNFSDPFGLKADCNGFWGCLKSFAAYQWRGFQAGADPTRTSIDFDTEAQFGALLGRASLAFAGAGRVAGAGGAASRAGIRIVEREGNHLIGAFNAAGGEARFVTELVRSGDDLILRGTHIEGSATLREALGVARAFGQELGVKRVIIEGGRRTTGANPGRVPRTIILEIGQ